MIVFQESVCLVFLNKVFHNLTSKPPPSFLCYLPSVIYCKTSSWPAYLFSTGPTISKNKNIQRDNSLPKYDDFCFQESYRCGELLDF